jgi:hypothetical protein
MRRARNVATGQLNEVQMWGALRYGIGNTQKSLLKTISYGAIWRRAGIKTPNRLLTFFTLTWLQGH